MTQSGDLLDSLQLDDTDSTNEAPPTNAPAPELPANPDGSQSPADLNTDGSVSHAPDPTIPPAWVPTGEPWRFKVDNTEVSPEGALLTEHGILIPQQSWDQIRPQYLGNRDVWRREREQWQAQVRDRDQAVAKSSQETQVAQNFLKSLVDEAQSDPDAFIGRLDQIIAGLPVRVAEAKTRIYEERENQRAMEYQQYQAAQASEELEGNLQSFLAQQVETALAKDFKGLTADRAEAAELLRELYDSHGLELFEGIDVQQANLAASQGWQMLTQIGDRLIGWYPHRFQSQLDRRMQRQKTLQDRWSKTAKVEQRNQATVTGPPVTTSPSKASAASTRHPTNGTFVAMTAKERAAKSRAMLDDLSLDDD